MVDCVYSRDGCDGGWPITAMDYIKGNSGAYMETDYPYTSGDTQAWGGRCNPPSATKGHAPARNVAPARSV